MYLSLNGHIFPNHGYVAISNIIGYTNDTALLCNTNHPPTGFNSGGNWFAPEGTRVGSAESTNVPGFTRNRGSMVVRLTRNTATGPAADGLYRCSIWDADENA